jgi:hypothetical protein
MACQSLVLQRILPLEALKLGLAVTNTDDPLQGYHEITLAPVNTTSLSSFSDHQRKETSVAFGVFLSGILKIGCRLKRGVEVDLKAARYSVQKLPNSDEWFENACTSQELRGWFEAKIERLGWRRLRLHLIVGLHIAKDVHFEMRQSSGHKTEFGAEVTLWSLLGDPGILGSILGNPGGTVISQKDVSSCQKFDAKEIIYAVQYRAVKIDWITAKLDKSYLSQKLCWKIMATEASVEDENRKAEVVEVGLVEEDYKTCEDTKVVFEDGDAREEFIMRGK